MTTEKLITALTRYDNDDTIYKIILFSQIDTHDFLNADSFDELVLLSQQLPDYCDLITSYDFREFELIRDYKTTEKLNGRPAYWLMIK